ncbi:MAG: L-lactate dehydrogenase [Propionibacteriaceae bacterium]|nr:L-lactate dehydrogenase [Propionibacteriaceae bacterium]
MTARGVNKVAIVGAGAVGSTLAYACLVRGVARHVVLHDINAAKVRAEALDLSHGVQFMPMAEVEGSDDVEITRGSDLVVVTAGAKQRPGQSRLELAEATVSLMKAIMPRLVERSPNAIFLMVTNPVDVVTYAALKISGLDPRQLFGSGTVLDSSRLRFLIAEQCGVAVQNVHAYIGGEHGDSEIPLWSTASVGGVPLTEWPGLCPDRREQIARQVVNAAYEIIEGKGATNYAIGLAASRIIESVLRDERRVLPVSTMLADWHGIGDVCMSVPTVVDRAGADERLPVPLSEEEHRLMSASADSIRSAARALGF